MRLVLLGDIHYRQRIPPPWHLLGKPLAAQMNVWFSRRRRFDMAVAEAVIARAAALRPDASLLTGDFTTTALAREFEQAAAALAPLLAAAPALAVPGNHDRYTFRATRARAVERALPAIVPAGFPACFDLGALLRGERRPPGGDTPWRVLALDAARPTLASSRGLLGEAQRRAAGECLRGVGRDQGVLVLCHYTLGKPPEHRPSARHHRLADADGLLEILGQCPGRVVFIHGHVHLPWAWPRPDPAPRGMLDINAGAIAQISADFPAGQGFWEMDLPADPRDAIALRHHLPARQPTGPGLDWSVRPVSVPSTR